MILVQYGTGIWPVHALMRMTIAPLIVWIVRVSWHVFSSIPRVQIREDIHSPS